MTSCLPNWGNRYFCYLYSPLLLVHSSFFTLLLSQPVIMDDDFDALNMLAIPAIPAKYERVFSSVKKMITAERN
jgi:hypothetical protein